jgi:diacylglycerol kinase (ATP)
MNVSERPWKRNYYNILTPRLTMDVFAIVNPLSGAGANPDVAAQRVAMLMQRFAAAGVTGGVHLTERRGHAAELAAIAAAQGARVLLGWGGDGTINEMGSAIAGTDAALAIVPAGSGNGFAGELGIPRDPAAAIDVAIRGRVRTIDAGELNGRLFFNIAGVGFDAAIAEQFNARARGRRGLGPYLQIGFREAFTYTCNRYQIALDGESIVSRALLVAFANGREYGNGLRLAPHARMDDGKLEALVVEDRQPLARLWTARHLALGTSHKAPGVISRSVTSARIEADCDILYHVDGEIGRAGGSVDVRIRPGLLKVKVP